MIADEIADILARIDDQESSLVAELARPLLERNHTRNWPLSSILGTATIGAPVSALDWVRRRREAEQTANRDG